MSRLSPPSRTSPHRSPFVLRNLDRIFFAAATLLLGFWSFWVLDSYFYQRSEGRKLEKLERAVTPPTRTTRAAHATDGLVGRIDIARLGLSAIIAEGTDESTLRRAVGHVGGTAFPGEPGNVALAAHRDTFFRKLKNIAVDDTIRLSTPDGVFTYVVDTTMVVKPDRDDLLDSTAVPSVTLVTCYPFYYIGHAPKRFIVQAIQVPTSAGNPGAAPAGAAPKSDVLRDRHSAGARLRRARRMRVS